ncbi:MAG TPA: nucleoside deaminase [Patescibacteria group bacterium]
MITQHQQEQLMREAIHEAKRGEREGEAPIGCVLAVLQDGQVDIVARGHNQMNRLHCRVAHAEIRAFENATNTSVPAVDLDAEGSILVSTLEPCVMCMGAAIEAGVKYVVFGLSSPADSGTQRVQETVFSPESSQPIVFGNVLERECRKLFADWLPQAKNPSQVLFVSQLLALTS